MIATITNRIRLAEAGPGELAEIAAALTLQNPEYVEALRMGRRTRDLESTLTLYKWVADELIVPWGVRFSLPAGTVIDDRTETHAVEFEWIGPALRDYQERAIQAILEAGGGVIQAPTGSGKTFTALNLITRLGQRTLVLVRNRDLAEQWRSEIRRVLGIEPGLWGSGKRCDGDIVVGLVQTVSSEPVEGFGAVLLDEAHSCPCRQSYETLTRTKARYRIGLTATPQRRDGLEPMLYAALGPIVAEITEQDVGAGVLPVTVAVRDVPYRGGNIDSWTALVSELAADPERNRLIVESTLKAAASAPVVVLTATIEHAERLGQMMDGALVVHGQLPAKVRRERMVLAQTTRILIGTMSLLSEGLDIPPLTSLIMAAPVSASTEKETPAATRLIQSIGRCRRPYPGKSRAFVLDLRDEHPMARSAAKKRMAVYAGKGFDIRQR
jgi:superfamily II DNA or RNA helicase